MGEKVTNILNRPVYVYLIGIMYLVYKISFIPFKIDFVVVIGYLLAFLFVTFCSVTIFTKLFKLKYIPVIMTAFWIMFLFHIQIMALFETFIKPPHIVRYKFLWPAIMLTGSFIAWLSYKFKKHNLLLNKIANVFLLCAIIVIVVNTGITVYNTIYRLKNNYKKYEYLTKVNLKKRDIIWILMDDYSNSFYLQSRFGFKNPLDSILSNEGFHVFKTMHSLSDATNYSVNSIFNLNDTVLPYSYDYGNYTLKNSALPRLLANIDYQFINESFFNIGNEPQIEVVSFYNPTLLYKLIDGTILQIYMQYKMLALYMKIWYPAKAMQKNYNGTVLKDLNSKLNQKHSKPVYVWAHLLIPHAPFFAIKNEKLVYVVEPIPSDTLGLKKVYIDYLSYGNQLIINLWKAHPELKDKIVIVSGDHGVRFKFLGNDSHRTQPFCAVYMPPGVDTTGISKINYISELPAFILKSQIVKNK